MPYAKIRLKCISCAYMHTHAYTHTNACAAVQDGIKLSLEQHERELWVLIDHRLSLSQQWDVVAKKTTNATQRCINRSTMFRARQEIAPALASLVRPPLERCVQVGTALYEGHQKPGGRSAEGKRSGKGAS